MLLGEIPDLKTTAVIGDDFKWAWELIDSLSYPVTYSFDGEIVEVLSND
jgi:hypothetical protein